MTLALSKLSKKAALPGALTLASTAATAHPASKPSTGGLHSTETI